MNSLKRKTGYKKNKISGFRRFLRNNKSRLILKMKRKKRRHKL